MKQFKNSLIYIFLFLLPKNLLSHVVGYLVGLRLPTSLALKVNNLFAQAFSIDLSEAEKPIEAYPSLQEFFIRRLKANARPIVNKEAIISPCDGFLSIAGNIDDGTLIQAKGKYYHLAELVGDYQLAARFLGGHYATIYLSPRDYHRFHAPVSGLVEKTIYIPGSLWPVNNWAVANVERLFCQNERVISLITEHKSKRLLAHIAVGATMVGKIDINYVDCYQVRRGGIEHPAVSLDAGQELGKFMFGSTIILLFEPGLMHDFVIKAPAKVKMGEILGTFNKAYES